MSTIYRMTYNNFEEQEVQTDIVDLSTPDDVDVIIELKAGEEGSIQIGAVDNDELKYGIKASRCIIKFINSDSVNLDTFSTGEDGRFKVFVRINTKNIFDGWLEQGNISEPFLPLGTQIVTLTAIDGLGYLGDISFVGFDGEIVNKLRTDITPAIHVARALFRTGLELNINVIDNRREENNPGQTWFDTCQIFPETFEDGINKAISCRDVLERIIGPDSYLYQSKGAWWIVRTTELRQDFLTYVTVFDSRGNYLSGPTEITLEKAIGSPTNTPFAAIPDATSYFSEAQTTKNKNRPYKATELDYNYDLPAEILCNSSFERGDFIADLPDETDPDGFTLQAKSYETDCWTYDKLVPPTTQDSDVYIKRLFSGGQEKERFIHFPETAVNAFYYLVSSELIPVGVYDKFTLSFNVRYNTDFGSFTGDFQHFEAWARLYADDGTFWSAHGVSGTQVDGLTPGNYWVETGSDWLGSSNFTQEGRAEAVDFTQWQSLSFDVAPIPRSGKLEIILINQDVTDTRTKDYGAINFEYIPYIDGSYKIVTGQSYTETQSGDYKRTLKQQVYISNAPRPIFKGAIKIIDGGEFKLAGKFYEGQQFPADDPTDADKFQFGELQVRAFHNQNRNTDLKVFATSQGLGAGPEDGDGNADQPDLLHRFYLRDQEPLTNTRAMQLVNQDVNWRTCAWTGTLIENFDTNIGFAEDTVVFQYIGGTFSSGGGGSGGGGGGGVTPASERFGVATEDDTAAQDRTFDGSGFNLIIQHLGSTYFQSATDITSEAYVPGSFANGVSSVAASSTLYSNIGGTTSKVEVKGVDGIRVVKDISGGAADLILYFVQLPVFADDAAAGVGGLTVDQVYKTATGELRIKL